MTVTTPVQFEQVDAAIGELKDHWTAMSTELDTREATIEQLQAQVADLEEQLKKALPQCAFGGCPAGGGTSLAAAQTVLTKWGTKRTAIRQFLGIDVAQRPVDAAVVHISWKPTLAQITDAWVSKVTANLKPGDVVEVWHEGDSKVRKGQLKRDDVIARKNTFFDCVKRVRPDLIVAHTLTGQALADYGNEEWQTWGIIKADLLGLDADGVHDTKAPLDIRYEDEISRVAQFLARFADGVLYTAGWAVPEFGTSRPTWDGQGLERAAWAKRYGAMFAAAGARYVCLFDYDVDLFKAGSPEFDAWQSLVAA